MRHFFGLIIVAVLAATLAAGASAGVWFSESSAMSKFVRLNFSCLRVLVADDTDGLAGTFAGARVG